MTNPYYTATGSPMAQTRGASSSIRNEYAAIQYAFDLVYAQAFASALPGITGSTAGMTITNDGATASWTAVPKSPWTVVSGTTQTAVAGNAYFIANVAATTITLPLSPAANDIVWIKVGNGLFTNIVNPNGLTIEGVSGNMTIDSTTAAFRLQYINSSWRVL